MKNKYLLLASLLVIAGCGSTNSSTSKPSEESSKITNTSSITFSSSETNSTIITSSSSSSSNEVVSSFDNTNNEKYWSKSELEKMNQIIGQAIPYYNYSVVYQLIVVDDSDKFDPYIYVGAEYEKEAAVEEYGNILLEEGYTFASTDEQAGYPAYYFHKPMNDVYSCVIQIEYFPGTSEFAPSFDIYAWSEETKNLPTPDDGGEVPGGVDLDGDGIIDIYDPVFNYVDSSSFPANTISTFYQTYNCDTPLPYFQSSEYSTAIGEYDTTSYLLINAVDEDNQIFDKFKHDCIALGWQINEEYSSDTQVLMKGNTGEKLRLDGMFSYADGVFTLNIFATKVYDSDRSFAYSSTCPTSTIESFIKTFYSLDMSFPSFKGDMFYVTYNEDYTYGIAQLRVMTVEENLNFPTQNELKEALINDGWEINEEYYTRFGYFATKNGVEIEFFSTTTGSFTLALYSESITQYM